MRGKGADKQWCPMNASPPVPSPLPDSSEIREILGVSVVPTQSRFFFGEGTRDLTQKGSYLVPKAKSMQQFSPSALLIPFILFSFTVSIILAGN